MQLNLKAYISNVVCLWNNLHQVRKPKGQTKMDKAKTQKTITMSTKKNQQQNKTNLG
jgi:hypothetical protein